MQTKRIGGDLSTIMHLVRDALDLPKYTICDFFFTTW